MPEPCESWVMVAAVSRTADAKEIAYALGLRSIPARTVRISLGLFKGKSVGVEVHTSDEARAREAVPFIIDGLLGPSRAATERGTCPYCGYDLTGVPSTRPCPECGRDLNTPEAREHARKMSGL